MCGHEKALESEFPTRGAAALCQQRTVKRAATQLNIFILSTKQFTYLNRFPKASYVIERMFT